jgi:hypothetical protein
VAGNLVNMIVMRKKAEFIFILFFFLLLLISECPANGLKRIDITRLSEELYSDTILGDVSFGSIKFNPIQLIFNEIPVSLEIDLPHDNSMQFQLGFIYPSSQNSGLRKVFESMGPNGDATSDGLFSYRKSPYNNYGLSFKLEFRSYGKTLYFGPQFMYKYCFYKEATFPIFNGSITRDITESKYSNILGFGFIFGRQSDNGELVYDWYGGLGFRIRLMSVTTVKIVDSPRPVSYPDTSEDFTSFYPFINLGVRIGFKLWKTEKN